MDNLIYGVGFREDNTEGYSQAEMDALNAELSERLEGLEVGGFDYYEVAKSFADEVSRRA